MRRRLSRRRNRRMTTSECRISQGDRRAIATRSRKKITVTSRDIGRHFLPYRSQAGIWLRCSCAFSRIYVAILPLDPSTFLDRYSAVPSLLHVLPANQHRNVKLCSTTGADGPVFAFAGANRRFAGRLQLADDPRETDLRVAYARSGVR